jgi:hypothetical protein
LPNDNIIKYFGKSSGTFAIIPQIETSPIEASIDETLVGFPFQVNVEF